MSAQVAVPSTKGQLKGWHALLWFVGFFGFMFVVNGIFLWTAITTFPGEDTEKSYAVGLAYNREIARRAHQAEAGWGACGMSSAVSSASSRPRSCASCRRCGPSCLSRRPSGAGTSPPQAGGDVVVLSIPSAAVPPLR